jgi:hypothetical protein
MLAMSRTRIRVRESIEDVPEEVLMERKRGKEKKVNPTSHRRTLQRGGGEVRWAMA